MRYVISHTSYTISIPFRFVILAKNPLKEEKKPNQTIMSNYVSMGEDVSKIPGLDDPNLSQEEKDLRLALALQQQENAAAYDQHKKRHDAAQSAQNTRTTRSNVSSRLAAVRKNQKEGGYDGMNDGSYLGPDASADARLAEELQKVGETTAKTAKIIAEDGEDAKAAKRRNGRSVF